MNEISSIRIQKELNVRKLEYSFVNINKQMEGQGTMERKTLENEKRKRKTIHFHSSISIRNCANSKSNTIIKRKHTICFDCE